MNEVPPPTEADMEIDVPGEYEYSYLVEKDERCEFRVQFVLGLLRRCHAAEVERDRLRMACDIFGDLIAIHIAENAERDQLRERAERAEDVLRSLASWLSAGGYQSENVSAAEYEAKIRWGVDHLLKVERDRLKAELAEAVAALKPLAEAEKWSYAESLPDDAAMIGRVIHSKGLVESKVVTVADCRRAAAIVAKHKPKETDR